MGYVLTLIVHGTFAADESWWRLGTGGGATFADRLEAALAARGLRGTVWRPALDAGLDYDSFSWSGQNRHRDRVAGAVGVAAAVNRLADRLGASVQEPLGLNLVAHSHGGNVALEALARLGPHVRANRVVFLGTPLIRSRPALRLARFFGALAALATLGVACAALLGVALVSPRHLLLAFALALAYVLAAGWLSWLVAIALDHLVALLAWPVRALRGRTAGQAYGPDPRVLRTILQERPIVLLTSHQDEADLLIQLGVAPRRLYLELIRARWGRLKRILELILLRPFVLGLGLELVGVFLERLVLGFGWWRVLWNDHEMADLDRGRAYPPTVLARDDVTSVLLPAIRAEARRELSSGPPAGDAHELSGEDRHAANFREVLREVVQNLRAQVRLRHGAYQKSDEIVDRLAALFTS